MCGIAGAIDLRGSAKFPPPRLLAMTGAITHRGPDDEHIHRRAGSRAGRARLSIVDLAGGRQPLCNEDGSIWVTQNGELFEYPELQQELLGRGHPLATRCDTELWVHLYEDLGEGMFEKARGQFAVALWDREHADADPGPRPGRHLPAPLRRGRRLAALGLGDQGTSRLGHGRGAGRRARASTSSSTPSAPARRERSSRGSSRSRPATTCGSSDGRVELKQYWDLDFPDAGEERRLSDPTPLVDELEFLMRRPVERRLRGDVPVVSYISGGLDSTVVLGLSSRQRGYAVPSFTIGLDRAGPDERSHAAESAQAWARSSRPSR